MTGKFHAWKKRFDQFKGPNWEPFHLSETFLYNKFLRAKLFKNEFFLKKKKNYINEFQINEMVPNFDP